MRNNDVAQEEEQVFGHETLEALKEFGKVLQGIHDRLVSEGKTIEIDDQYKQKNQN